MKGQKSERELDIMFSSLAFESFQHIFIEFYNIIYDTALRMRI